MYCQKNSNIYRIGRRYRLVSVIVPKIAITEKFTTNMRSQSSYASSKLENNFCIQKKLFFRHNLLEVMLSPLFVCLFARRIGLTEKVRVNLHEIWKPVDQGPKST